MIEPSSPSEAKEFTKLAFEISEDFDRAVIVRITTRIAHSQGLVQLEDKVDVPLKPFERNPKKYVMIPAHARPRHKFIEEQMVKLREYSNRSVLNRIEWGDKKRGIITNGVAYQYVKEVCPRDSVLKIGFAWPLPDERIKEFAVTPATAKSEVYFRGDDFLKLRIDTEAETTGGVNVTYVPGATGSSHLNARLGGRNGAIISRATTNSTYYNFTGMTYEPVLKQFEDGDVLTGQTITLGSALSNMKIKLVMGTGGVTYESTGTNTMYAESGDFDANAQFNYYLVTPPSNNNCHTLDSVTDED